MNQKKEILGVKGDFKDILPNRFTSLKSLTQETNQEFSEHGIINHLYLIPNVSKTRLTLNFKKTF